MPNLLLTLALLLFSQAPFEAARSGRSLTFPRDHGAHPEFQTEWWYFTGHLTSTEGRRFGFELTFFRVALDGIPASQSSWSPQQLYPAHFAISDLDGGQFRFSEKISREGAGLAGSERDKLSVWVHNWFARFIGEDLHLRAAVPGMKLELQLRPGKAPVLHGDRGFSRKGPEAGQASHYYSITRLEGAGRLELDGSSHDVQTSAWMDHEFMSNVLSEQEIGWDWFSLQLEGGEDLMLFQVRRAGQQAPFISGTWVGPSGAAVALDGSEIELEPLDYWTSPETGSRYPVAWKIAIPSRNLELEIRASIPNQELITLRSTGVVYWEGSVEASGRNGPLQIKGRGYLEMTGYGGPRPGI